MDPEIKKSFDQAAAYSKRGDNFAEEGNYQNAAKCYLKVSKLLSGLLQITQKQKSIQDLREKIEKYTNLAAANQAKHKQKESSKVVISKFGFPTEKKVEIPLFMSQAQIQNKNTSDIIKNKSFQNISHNRETQKVDPEIEGLISKNLKHSFKDIIGMEQVKELLYEAVIFPQKRPDLFEGIRSPPKGILLYGPPGNGKTFIVKALAKESGCVFYGLSAGSILNKFVGQSEKMLKKIFLSAKKTKPSIIFIDEIDSIITARTQNENDSSRRLKTQFLVQFDSLQPNDQVILVGATNFPGELDMAALRRFNKMIYIGLPDGEARRGIVQNNLAKINSEVSNSEMKKIVKDLQGYSASEITDIIKQASMLPLRDIKKSMMESVSKSKIRPVKYDDFMKTIKQRKPLMTKEQLKKYDGRFK